MTLREMTHPPSRAEAADALHHAAVPFPLALREVIREIPEAVLCNSADESVCVTGVHQDSRRVDPGDLFVARAGMQTNGARYIDQALARGAAAVLVERGSAADTGSCPRIEAVDVPRALAYAAAVIYGHPTFALEVVGITGTNGKTTTAHLVQAVIDASGSRCGVIGTVGYRFADLDLPAPHTSPEADDLARISAAMCARGASHLVMEVSSIAIIQKRTDAVRFRVAAFTNLTQDHLDFHGSMEAYAEAKARLFFELAPGAAALNVDDAFGRELFRRLSIDGLAGRTEVPVARFSAVVGAGPDEAEIAPITLAHTRAGIEVFARTPAGPVTIRSRLLGAHNIENLLTALSIAYLLDVDVEVAAEALSAAPGVPGRLERCDVPDRDDVVVLVDYAHTPDALERVLASVRGLLCGADARGAKIRCVFGCGGDRDPKKRPLMGSAVARLADVAIVTNDNPRSEDPLAIVDAILPGLQGGSAHLVVELDRRRAIELAVLGADPGDVVLIAGKGHEAYQIIGSVTAPFDDRHEARRALGERRDARGGRS